MQTSSTILMVRPANFGFNPETAENNFYQQSDTRPLSEINSLAQKEFDGFVAMLRDQGVNVIVEEDTPEPVKPDAVFPNNWFSTHPDGKLILYPMFSPNRRLERRKDLIEDLMKRKFKVDEIIDLSFFEDDEQYLEGTGSMVIDHQAKIIYACYSERTHAIPLDYLSKILGYEVVGFHAIQDVHGVLSPIYHTNVMMHIGTDLAVVCLDSIPKASEKQAVQKSLTQAGKKLVPITPKQKFHFAGNMLEVGNDGGEKFTIMSETALESLNVGQIQLIEKYSTIISPSIPTIEKLGGGSARCMMAEIFLPLANS
ncbi:arginine deiminase-related protein [Algoriphagus sp. D3-2-R+10]|uniref:citrulline utilization hydrolase CtlX n=1 Tax=Algoriphagus aurantiacus TaxID=3103948 RepID=UPI002B39B021|nr:arginine deiminase-related protein [Algoriphagus sp. D3-2-R+10]MEB2777975.1 arginine deiminase-related protein [Algoriphagus sp. D3-2-R+10]